MKTTIVGCHPRRATLLTVVLTVAFNGLVTAPRSYAQQRAQKTEPAATVIEVPKRAALVGQKVALSATLRLAGSQAPIAGQRLTFRVDGDGYYGTFFGDATTNAAGTATIDDVWGPQEKLGAGLKGFTVAYAGNTSYAASSARGDLLVLKSPTVITFVPFPNSMDVILTRTSDGEGVAGRPVKVSVNGATLTTVTTASQPALRKGHSNIKINVLANEHDMVIAAEFAGDSVYAAYFAEHTYKAVPNRVMPTLRFSVTPLTVGRIARLTATLTYASKPVAGRVIFCSAIGQQTNVNARQVGKAIKTGSDGVAVIDFPVTEGFIVEYYEGGMKKRGDQWEIAATSDGDETHYSAFWGEKVKVLPGMLDLHLKVVPAIPRAGQNLTMVATVRSADGLPVAPVAVEFVVDGYSLGTAMTDGTGQATFHTLALLAMSQKTLRAIVRPKPWYLDRSTETKLIVQPATK